MRLNDICQHPCLFLRKTKKRHLRYSVASLCLALVTSNKVKAEESSRRPRKREMVPSMRILSIALLPVFTYFQPRVSLAFPHQQQQHVLLLGQSSEQGSTTSFHYPTIHESAVQARRILNLSSIATFSTVFPPPLPSKNNSASAPNYSNPGNRPDGVAGAPIGQMEYYASCGPDLYNPTILAVTIATTYANARAGSNVTLSLRYHPPSNHPASKDPYTYSPANLPRFSLIGRIEPLSREEIERNEIEACFLARHPDAKIWTPGNDIHESWWARLVVEEVYWFGGFGDRAYIGWIPADVYRAVTEKEVEAIRLVGEEKRGR